MIAFLFLLVGCVQVEESVTLYIYSTGELDFVAYLDNIHSDEKEADKRKKEEAQFLADFKSGKALKKPLEKFGATKIKQEMFRTEAPFAGAISGHFKSIENFWKAFDFNGNDKDRTAKIKKSGNTTSLIFRLPAKADDGGNKHDFPKNLKFVHADGKFTGAEGFAVSLDGRTARLDVSHVESMISKKDPYQVSLSW